MRYLTIILFAVFALALAIPVMAENTDTENICDVLTSEDLDKASINADLRDECLASATDNGVPLSVANRVERESYCRLIEVGTIPGESCDLSVESEELVAVAINLAYWPEYYGANRSVFYGGSVWQPDATFTSPRLQGWSLNLWASTGADNSSVSFGNHDGGDFDDEIDITLGKSGSFAGFDYNASLAYYRINVAPADVWNPFLEVSRTFQFSRWLLTPYVKGEYYFPNHGQEPLSGSIVRTGVRSDIRLNERWSISPWIGGFHDSGAFGSDSGWLLEGGGEVVRKVTPSLSFALPVKCGYPVSDLSDGREPKCVAGLALRF